MVKIELKHGTAIIDKNVAEALRLLNFKMHTKVKDKKRNYVIVMLRMGFNNFNRRSLEIPLHRFLKGNPKGYEVDHINKNPLDNRIKHLRIATKQLNMMNTGARKGTSIYKGVSWRKKSKKWGAFIVYNGKQSNLGEFNCPHDAAEIYNKKSKELAGEFAFQNIIDRSKSGVSEHFHELVGEYVPPALCNCDK